MRAFVLTALAVIATAPSAQTLPQFADYPAGPVYRGRVAALDVTSSPNARLYRTRTREAMADGVNFAGHYVVARWGCGTECMGGQIVDARTGRAVADLPTDTPYVSFRPDSRLIAVMTPADVADRFGDDPDVAISPYFGSSYWVLEGDSLRHLGSLIASDLEQIRRGGPTPTLCHATPGDVLVPLAVGNTWTYATPAGTVTYRVTGPSEGGYQMQVERAQRGPGGEQRTTEQWRTSDLIGDGSLSISTDDAYRGFEYHFGVPEVDRADRIERTTVRVGTESHEAICYIDAVGEYETERTRPSRTCFVPRLGMVSDDRDGAMTLTSYTLR